MKLSNEFFDILHTANLRMAKKREILEDIQFIRYLYNRPYVLLSIVASSPEPARNKVDRLLYLVKARQDIGCCGIVGDSVRNS